MGVKNPTMQTGQLFTTSNPKKLCCKESPCSSGLQGGFVTDQLFFHRGKFTLKTVLRVKQHEPAEDFLSEQARLRQHAGSFRKGGYYACSAASPMRTPTRILSHLFGLPRPRAATCCVATHSHAHATHARTHARTLARTRNARALARSLARAHTHAHTHTHTRSIRAAVQLCADHAFRAAGGTFACIGRDSRARPACGLRVRACSDPKLGMQTRHTLDISRDLQVRACMCACVRCGVCAYAHDLAHMQTHPCPRTGASLHVGIAIYPECAG